MDETPTPTPSPSPLLDPISIFLIVEECVGLPTAPEDVIEFFQEPLIVELVKLEEIQRLFCIALKDGTIEQYTSFEKASVALKKHQKKLEEEEDKLFYQVDEEMIWAHKNPTSLPKST